MGQSNAGENVPSRSGESRDQQNHHQKVAHRVVRYARLGRCRSVPADIGGSHDVHPLWVVVRLSQGKPFRLLPAHKHATEQAMSFDRQPVAATVRADCECTLYGLVGKRIESAHRRLLQCTMPFGNDGSRRSFTAPIRSGPAQ
jgi:hypothetical protein